MNQNFEGTMVSETMGQKEKLIRTILAQKMTKNSLVFLKNRKYNIFYIVYKNVNNK